MKKGLVPSLVLIAISLSSCVLFTPLVVVEKDISVYDIDSISSDGQLSDAFQCTVKACFKEGEDLIPYLTIEQYASLYADHLANDAESKVTYSLMFTDWTITKGDSPVFIARFSNVSKEIAVGGNIEAAYKQGDDPRDLKALNYGMKNDTSGEFVDGSGSLYFSYRNYGLSTFKYNDERYYPLGLLDITLSESAGMYFAYNYKHIIATREADNYATKYYYDEGTSYCFDTQMEAMTSGASVPSYLLKYNAGLFVYMMDHLYGLKDYKRVSSFENYWRSKGFYSRLFNKDGQTRVQAYSDALSILDDNHTVLVSANNAWGESEFVRRRYGQKAQNRGLLKSTLTTHRTNAYNAYQENGSVKPSTPEKDILYSSDGKTALFSFDSFIFGTTAQVFNNDDSIKESAKDYDTFFKLIDAFNRIKAKGGVDNVIIDISVNGGGVVGVLIKLLSLISKDNDSYFCFYNEAIGQASIYHSHVDSNGDGEYNAADCYGNDFNFYLLTSDCSFSCGNAFPCLAQHFGMAKIIGQKSGGGECSVAIHYLPNSEYVYHSSNLHIGYFEGENKVFHGFESGATPDFPLEINENFYSVDNLNNIIKTAE